jgi:PAT family beta-lactamase induction signal transducer AmpG
MSSAVALLRQTFTDSRLALMLALGYSSGLPFLLIFSTQSAWLREAGVSRSAIGLMSYCALAFTFKFAWAPFIDRYDPPGLGALLGRRRGWMLIAQVGVALGLVGLSFGAPARSLAWSIAFAFLTAFAAASQDVTIDGWRIDAAPPERQGMMTAVYNLGYRLAMICAGAGAFYIADFASWRAAYLAMACLTLIGICACLLSPRLDRAPVAERPTLGAAFVAPLRDLIARLGPALVAILLLVAFYRLPDFVSGVMANPLYIDLGFTKSDIATVSKLYGVWIGIAGAFGGGLAVGRLGLMPALLIGGVAASVSHLSLAYLALNGGARLDLLTVAVSAESFASGFAGAALIAYMSSLVSPKYAATQYALLSSLYALPGKFVGGLSGILVDAFGYPRFFTATAMIGAPVAVLCLIVWRFGRVRRNDSHLDSPRADNAGRARQL